MIWYDETVACKTCACRAEDMRSCCGRCRRYCRVDRQSVHRCVNST